MSLADKYGNELRGHDLGQTEAQRSSSSGGVDGWHGKISRDQAAKVRQTAWRESGPMSRLAAGAAILHVSLWRCFGIFCYNMPAWSPASHLFLSSTCAHGLACTCVLYLRLQLAKQEERTVNLSKVSSKAEEARRKREAAEVEQRTAAATALAARLQERAGTAAEVLTARVAAAGDSWVSATAT